MITKIKGRFFKLRGAKTCAIFSFWAFASSTLFDSPCVWVFKLEFSDERFSFVLAKAVVPGMKKRGNGSIIFISSMTAFIGMPNVLAYSAAKAGLNGMMRCLASELGGAGIRVNSIAPGWIDTPMLHKAIDGDQPRIDKILGRTPTHTFGRPDDIGWAATYLASDAAKFVNGQVLVVDGGASIGF